MNQAVAEAMVALVTEEADTGAVDTAIQAPLGMVVVATAAVATAAAATAAPDMVSQLKRDAHVAAIVLQLTLTCCNRVCEYDTRNAQVAAAAAADT